MGRQPFRYHSGIAEKDPPYYTLIYGVRRTLDVVASNFAEGVCQVLGELPGTSRLDGGRRQRSPGGVWGIKFFSVNSWQEQQSTERNGVGYE